MIKATKVHVMASAPFDKTIMLDLDSFPCHSGFALPLLEAFGTSDIGFTNVVDDMASVRDSRHFLGEHNSALVVLNMKSTRTRMLMALYIQAYHKASEMKKTGRQRDQPSLLIARQGKKRLIVCASITLFQFFNLWLYSGYIYPYFVVDNM